MAEAAAAPVHQVHLAVCLVCPSLLTLQTQRLTIPTGGARSGSSNSGGRTTTGSGVSPSYGGGRYYGGGAAMPYRSGARSPLGITPFILPLAALSIFPGLWLYSVYAYPYTHPYSFYNTSANANQTKPVQCLCEEYSECGCDDNTDSEFVSSVVGSGAYAALDKTLVNVADVNGTSTIVLNGTLPNGTTASGGTTDGTSSAGIRNSALEHMGLWVMGAVVVYGVWFL